MTPAKFIFALAAAGLLVSCGSPEKPAETTTTTTVEKVQDSLANNPSGDGQKEVMEESVAFYKAVHEGSFDGAVEFLHPKAIEATPKSEWIKLLENTKAKFGKLLSTNVIDSRKWEQVNTAVGTADFYQIAFENKYENGTLYEILSFAKENPKEKAKMLSYVYDTDKSKLSFENFGKAN